ncbi:hypothetical protein FC84_GL000836 [Lapidilactobacillus dextrinicus DSM 20335]|uniref:Mga helix-turn-helix domain-containing protein n=1 Tax=Lapidilactobacillus dextrinicus DSM 20335 TaxID=1423738 RepID=A0A0R2BH09_9LACO|nr:helix-turn-helix domain-containing protein [Lapidilactobacillus dextrinicus]KRM78577.1 hypothetical protein FC84_GL000836 [Lapidilactobacillus dextrinicus DSM 20335]QFG46106.1 helix-turn-helix domain-containing protein [Lapidilactobacillus dextrinicus]
MNLFQLLNKNTALEIDIVKVILAAGPRISKSQLRKTLNISNFTLTGALTHIQSVFDEVKINATLEIEDVDSVTYVRVKKEPTTDIFDFYYAYLADSLEYQILRYLFHKQSFTRIQLIQTLSISEGSLYRYLNHLNELLHEFNLAIKNGRIVGEELQINYFYFELIWNSVPTNEIHALITNDRIQHTVTALESSLDTTFNDHTKMRAALWLLILQKRSTIELTTNSVSKQLLKEITRDPLFNQVQTVYLRFTIGNAQAGSSFKSVYLYLFLISMFIFDTNNHFIFKLGGTWPTPLSQIKHTAQWIVEFVTDNLNVDLDDFPENFTLRWYSVLTQLLTQIYFFQSNITFISTDNQCITQTKYTKSLIEPIIKKVLTDFSKPTISDTMKIYGYSILESFIESSHKYAKHHLRIGIFARKDYFSALYLVEQFASEFSGSFNLDIEIATPTQKYDLLVTDSPLSVSRYHFAKQYVLAGRLNALDREMLATILNNIMESVN